LVWIWQTERDKWLITQLSQLLDTAYLRGNVTGQGLLMFRFTIKVARLSFPLCCA